MYGTERRRARSSVNEVREEVSAVEEAKIC